MRKGRSLVLVVDDDPAIGEALRFALRDDYRIEVAGNAVAGLRAMTDDVAVVVLDIKMEGRDGFWLCEQIQKKCPYTPIIFHSAYQDVKNPYDVINDHRPFAYIVKGNPDDLFDAILRAVNLRQRLLDNQDVLTRLASVQQRMKAFRR